MLTLFSFLFFCFLFGFSSFIYFYHILIFFEFGSLESQTRWRTSTVTCITPCFRRPKLTIIFCFITASEKYVNIKAFGWNGSCHSSVQQKTHPKSFHKASLSMLNFLRNSATCSQFTTGSFVSTLRKYLQLGFWCNKKLRDVKTQIILT